MAQTAFKKIKAHTHAIIIKTHPQYLYMEMIKCIRLFSALKFKPSKNKTRYNQLFFPAMLKKSAKWAMVVNSFTTNR